MFKTLIKRSWIFIIIIGCLALATGYLSGAIQLSNPSFSYSIIQKHTTYLYGSQWTYYTIDIQRYLTNLEQAADPRTMPLESFLPTRPQIPNWPNLTWTIDNWFTVLGAYINAISKLIIYELNWIIYVVSIILTAIPKIIIWPMKCFLALIGLNTSDNSFYMFVQSIYEIQIPYIPTNY